MLSTVSKYIEKHHLLKPGQPVITGVSGGADSVALLLLLHQLGYGCIIAHCNFHLRGEESDRDEAFVKNLAQNLQIPFYKKDFETSLYAKEKKVSIEMAARELRYNWFSELAKNHQTNAIAVAHHADDQAETVLLNLIRGTGIKGLRGMLPHNGEIIRPLLETGRQEILEWLKEKGTTYVTDSTNETEDYTRNFIRLRVIPLLKQINPSVQRNINQTASHIAETEQLYNYIIDKARKKVWLDNNRLSIIKLLQFPAPGTILYELLKPYGFNSSTCREILEGLTATPGKQYYSSCYVITKDRDHLWLTPRDQNLTTPYILEKEEGEWETPVKLSIHKTVISKEFCLLKDKHIAYFDYDKLSFPLYLRTWQSGDWFVPFGMNGRKKLSDYFSDHKYSRPEKDKQWLLCCGSDIIWILGERSDERYRITPETRNVLIVKISI